MRILDRLSIFILDSAQYTNGDKTKNRFKFQIPLVQDRI